MYWGWLIFICIIFICTPWLRLALPSGGNKRIWSNWAEYVTGRVPLGAISTICTICATLIGATSMMVVALWILHDGDSAAWYLIAPGLGLICLGIWGVKHVRNQPGLTIPQYFSNKYLKLFLSIFIVAIYTLVLGAQIVGFAKISLGFNVSYLFGIILCGSVITIYVGLGGFRSVVDTDVIQFIMMVIAVSVLFFSSGDVTKINYSNFCNPFGGSVPRPKSLLFISMGFMMLVAQENHQRIKAAVNERTARLACIISGLIIILFSMVIAAVVHSVEGMNDDPMVNAIQQLPAFGAIIVSVGFLSAALSTADSALNIATSQATSLLKVNEKPLIIFSIQVLCIITAVVIAHYVPSVPKIILLCLNIYVGILLPLVTSAFLLKLERFRISVFIATACVLILGYVWNVSVPGLLALGVGVTCLLIMWMIQYGNQRIH